MSCRFPLPWHRSRRHRNLLAPFRLHVHSPHDVICGRKAGHRSMHRAIAPNRDTKHDHTRIGKSFELHS